ncbi:MAG: ATP-binding protein, partial [Candidatus Nanopelagicaceae bacterium]
MFNAQALTEKWSPVLGHEGAGAIKDNYRKAVTAVLLENTERALREERGMINEASNTVGAIGSNALSGSALGTQTGGLAGFDPVMISLIRRAMPNLVAYDICGVQPMSGPTGLIFAMKYHYQENGSALRGGPEALYNEADSNFSASSAGSAVYNQTNAAGGDDTHPRGDGGVTDANPGLLNDGGTYERGATAIPRETAEVLGSGATLFNEMSFSIEKTSVQARTRALKAEYTLELAQDLKAIHGLDAEQELANLLSSEILAEINREVVRTVYTVAKPGAQNNVANAGIF